jgi:hypothetical protein
MSITVKVHPFGEMLSKLLFGIETIPPEAIKRARTRAIKAAMAEYDKMKCCGNCKHYTVLEQDRCDQCDIDQNIIIYGDSICDKWEMR